MNAADSARKIMSGYQSFAPTVSNAPVPLQEVVIKIGGAAQAGFNEVSLPSGKKFNTSGSLDFSSWSMKRRLLTTIFVAAAVFAIVATIVQLRSSKDESKKPQPTLSPAIPVDFSKQAELICKELPSAAAEYIGWTNGTKVQAARIIMTDVYLKLCGGSHVTDPNIVETSRAVIASCQDVIMQEGAKVLVQDALPALNSSLTNVPCTIKNHCYLANGNTLQDAYDHLLYLQPQKAMCTAAKSVVEFICDRWNRQQIVLEPVFGPNSTYVCTKVHNLPSTITLFNGAALPGRNC